jgi:hypothetical protein
MSEGIHDEIKNHRSNSKSKATINLKNKERYWADSELFLHSYDGVFKHVPAGWQFSQHNLAIGYCLLHFGNHFPTTHVIKYKRYAGSFTHSCFPSSNLLLEEIFTDIL